MHTLQLPCPVGEVSDGYHTFNELYDHRCALFLALLRAMPGQGWASTKHADGTEIEGYFIAGLNLPDGTITYHLPDSLWLLTAKCGVPLLPTAPPWDGHTSAAVVERLHCFAAQTARRS